VFVRSPARRSRRRRRAASRAGDATRVSAASPQTQPHRTETGHCSSACVMCYLPLKHSFARQPLDHTFAACLTASLTLLPTPSLFLVTAPYRLVTLPSVRLVHRSRLFLSWLLSQVSHSRSPASVVVFFSGEEGTRHLPLHSHSRLIGYLLLYQVSLESSPRIELPALLYAASNEASVPSCCFPRALDCLTSLGQEPTRCCRCKWPRTSRHCWLDEPEGIRGTKEIAQAASRSHQQTSR
jgi:hypothetical protein